jgi:hypothetical protein
MGAWWRKGKFPSNRLNGIFNILQECKFYHTSNIQFEQMGGLSSSEWAIKNYFTVLPRRFRKMWTHLKKHHLEWVSCLTDQKKCLIFLCLCDLMTPSQRECTLKTYIYRIFCPTVTEYTQVSVHGTFSKIDHILEHRKYKQIQNQNNLLYLITA